MYNPFHYYLKNYALLTNPTSQNTENVTTTESVATTNALSTTTNTLATTTNALVTTNALTTTINELVPTTNELSSTSNALSRTMTATKEATLETELSFQMPITTAPPTLSMNTKSYYLTIESTVNTVSTITSATGQNAPNTVNMPPMWPSWPNMPFNMPPPPFPPQFMPRQPRIPPYSRQRYHGPPRMRPQIHLPSNNPALPPPPSKTPTDQDIINIFEDKIAEAKKSAPKMSEIYQKMVICCTAIEDLQAKREHLNRIISNEASDEQWEYLIVDTRNDVEMINNLLDEITTSDVLSIKKLYFKRRNRVSRRKKLMLRRKVEKEQRKKEKQEQVRKMNEKMQKMKDDIDQAKQEEIAKVKADIVLKDVLRKKHDAKKCLTKLETLVKLRVARDNTLKGRGQDTSVTERMHFDAEIEKLKDLWTDKLSRYEKEETELRNRLNAESSKKVLPSVEATNKIEKNLEKWKKVLFGGEWPQVDFQGNIGMFVGIRSKWDEFLDEDGKSLPMGWVVPPLKNSFS